VNKKELSKTVIETDFDLTTNSYPLRLNAAWKSPDQHLNLHRRKYLKSSN